MTRRAANLLLLSCAIAALSCEPKTAPAPVASTTGRGTTRAAPPADSPPAVASAPPVASSEAVDAGPKQVRLVVHLVPIGVVPKEMMDATVEGLRTHAPVDPIVEQAQDFPAASRSPEKNRYRADALLDWLAGLPIEKTGKIMGITEADIFTRKGNIPTWGILGLGSLDGRCSVLSTWRMKRKWENGGASDAVVRDRLWKTTVHELGHTLGLEHCPNVGCVMEDGKGTVKTTDREKELCPSCAARYAEAIRRLVQ